MADPTPTLATAKAQTDLAESAGKLEESASVQADSADRGTELAADRTILPTALVGMWIA